MIKVLPCCIKKINKGIKAQGKEKLINFMKPITNGLAKVHIDLRKKVYKQIIDNLGGKIRLVIHGGAPADKATIWNCACKFINGPEGNCGEKASKQ